MKKSYLRVRAAQQGQDAQTYALTLLRQDFQAAPPPAAQKHNVMEFYGVGRDTWQGVDVQQYIREMRDEWDRPTDED